MPGGDRRGPLGAGPMTGRASGVCAGNDRPGYLKRRGRDRSAGGGFGGRGRGFRCMFYLTGIPGFLRFFKDFSRNGREYTKEDEVQTLKNQSKYLARALEGANRRLSELEKEKE